MMRHRSGRILLVDDEPLVRKLISLYLVAAGYVVRTAVDGLDAIGKLRAGPMDLIISDLNMPRMSGAELLKVVRRRFLQIPVIVISGDTADEMPEGVAADAYCHKNGVDFDHLLETMSNLDRNPPHRTVPPRVDNKPVQAIGNKDGNCNIGCEDCLREFSAPPASFMSGEVKSRPSACTAGKSFTSSSLTGIRTDSSHSFERRNVCRLNFTIKITESAIPSTWARNTVLPLLTR
jgi:CheY-like chemotaxis protein